jgi:hypothetical protein
VLSKAQRDTKDAALHKRFPTSSSMEQPLKQFLVPQDSPIYENKNKTKSLLLVAHGDYSNIANYGTKIPPIYQEIFGIFRGTT